MDYSISDLKKALGSGISSNKYLLEMYSPIASMDASQLNMLCKSAKFPARTIATAEIWRYGRKYNTRAETQYGDTMSLTFIDDGSASIRTFFDTWLELVDNSGTSSMLDSSSYESALSSVLSVVNGGEDSVTNLVQSVLDSDFAAAVATYQSNINVWALDHDKEKIYGYKYQNCYPTGISEVVFADENQNKLVEFDVTFTFSEFAPLSNTSALDMIVDTAIDDIAESSLTMEKVFD